MVRSLRLSSFALVASIALFGFGCGGGGDDKPATQEDGGSKIQLDGGTVKQDASSPTQQDSGSGGGTNTCTTGGGNATGGLCSHFNSDCQCPNDCMNLFYEQDPTTKSSGSCWPQVDATSETGCPSGQVPVQFTETDPGHCYPSGTLSGTFEVPVGTAQSQLGGTANVTLTMGSKTITYTTGSAYLSDNYWIIILANIGTSQADVLEVIMDAAAYTPATIDFATATTAQIANLTQTSSAMTLNALNLMEGSMALTAAPTTAGGNATGSFTGVAMMGYITELCGMHSEPCQ